MRIIIGFGNDLRGEDAFGVDTISKLQKLELKNTKLISVFQLTPELSLEIQDASELIFIDAAASLDNHYKLACSFEQMKQNSLSHHISIKMILKILEELYMVKPKYQVFSMLTNNFDKIIEDKKYNMCIERVVKFIENS